MSTAWENLVAGSTLTSGTAWGHLNAQGDGGETVYVDRISGSMSAMVLGASLQTQEMTAGITDGAMTSTIGGETLTAGIIVQDIGSSIVASSLSADISNPALAANIIEVEP